MIPEPGDRSMVMWSFEVRPEPWADLCHRMAPWDGPWQLTVGRPLHRQDDNP